MFTAVVGHSEDLDSLFEEALAALRDTASRSTANIQLPTPKESG